MITTQRLTLRPLTLDDWQFVIDIFSQPDFIRNVADKGIRTQADAIAYLEQGPMLCQQTHGFSMLAMELTLDLSSSSQTDVQPKVIGLCGLLQRDNMPYPDIGYALLPQYYRKGYTFEAAEGVLGHFSDIRPVLAVTSVDNDASQQLLRKLGFNKADADLVANAFDESVSVFQLV
ncbi:GNAT family N-acetyltransferase [Thalassotalea euphylliae]|uniref:N-acetyltransferase n=1 Tax=Thalassotalea euphylliae TaxID=1655234 RepID=A0A3E0U6H3_9GAMM|nr:GNAT family N-acetyltransferase [Thalassotalea euphylliae]REL32380.1 N-acetyltransferase [Thalassotalea euphylliae]